MIGVDARTPKDIQAAVNFAIQYNLKLVVKNTGLVKSQVHLIIVILMGVLGMISWDAVQPEERSWCGRTT